jgi:hypothetical protein
MINFGEFYWIIFIVLVCKNQQAIWKGATKITPAGWVALAMFSFPIIPRVMFNFIDLFLD